MCPLPQVAETYNNALATVNPRKATANFHRLYINFAKFYEEGGTTGEAEKDIDNARKILLKATKVNFKTVDELAEVWCEWAEMEIRQEYVLCRRPEGSFFNGMLGTTTKQSVSCSAPLSYPRTPRSTSSTT